MTSLSAQAATLRAGYAARLDHALRAVPPDMAQDLRIELLGHLDHLAQGDSSGDPAGAMRAAIDRLGEPAQLLSALAADEQVRRAAQGQAPLPLLRGLVLRMAAGGQRGLVAGALLLAFAFALTLVLIGLLAPFFPHHVGLLEFADGQRMFGVSSEPALREHLGAWRLPIGALGGLALWQLLRMSVVRYWAKN